MSEGGVVGDVPPSPLSRGASGPPVICAECGEQIVLKFVRAFGQTFHVHHLVCCECGTLLRSSSAYRKPETGKIFCEQHFGPVTEAETPVRSKRRPSRFQQSTTFENLTTSFSALSLGLYAQSSSDYDFGGRRAAQSRAGGSFHSSPYSFSNSIRASRSTGVSEPEHRHYSPSVISTPANLGSPMPSRIPACSTPEPRAMRQRDGDLELGIGRSPLGRSQDKYLGSGLQKTEFERRSQEDLQKQMAQKQEKLRSARAAFESERHSELKKMDEMERTQERNRELETREAERWLFQMSQDRKQEQLKRETLEIPSESPSQEIREVESSSLTVEPRKSVQIEEPQQSRDEQDAKVEVVSTREFDVDAKDGRRAAEGWVEPEATQSLKEIQDPNAVNTDVTDESAVSVWEAEKRRRVEELRMERAKNMSGKKPLLSVVPEGEEADTSGSLGFRGESVSVPVRVHGRSRDESTGEERSSSSASNRLSLRRGRRTVSSVSSSTDRSYRTRNRTSSARPDSSLNIRAPGSSGGRDRTDSTSSQRGRRQTLMKSITQFRFGGAKKAPLAGLGVGAGGDEGRVSSSRSGESIEGIMKKSGSDSFVIGDVSRPVAIRRKRLAAVDDQEEKERITKMRRLKAGKEEARRSRPAARSSRLKRSATRMVNLFAAKGRSGSGEVGSPDLEDEKDDVKSVKLDQEELDGDELRDLDEERIDWDGIPSDLDDEDPPLLQMKRAATRPPQTPSMIRSPLLEQPSSLRTTPSCILGRPEFAKIVVGGDSRTKAKLGRRESDAELILQAGHADLSGVYVDAVLMDLAKPVVLGNIGDPFPVPDLSAFGVEEVGPHRKTKSRGFFLSPPFRRGPSAQQRQKAGLASLSMNRPFGSTYVVMEKVEEEEEEEEEVVVNGEWSGKKASGGAALSPGPAYLKRHPTEGAAGASNEPVMETAGKTDAPPTYLKRRPGALTTVTETREEPTVAGVEPSAEPAEPGYIKRSETAACGSSGAAPQYLKRAVTTDTSSHVGSQGKHAEDERGRFHARKRTLVASAALLLPIAPPLSVLSSGLLVRRLRKRRKTAVHGPPKHDKRVRVTMPESTEEPAQLARSVTMGYVAGEDEGGLVVDKIELSEGEESGDGSDGESGDLVISPAGEDRSPIRARELLPDQDAFSVDFLDSLLTPMSDGKLEDEGTRSESERGDDGDMSAPRSSSPGPDELPPELLALLE